MRFKEVKELTEMEEKIRWNLQMEHNRRQENINEPNAEAEWNGALRFANSIVESPKRWGVRAGVVVLMGEIK